MTNPEPAADAASPTIPVICDKCRAEGVAGDAGFAEVADILNFEPVPRRAQVNNWTAEHQRAFIAALAITGSAVRAARALGRHPHGAEKLRSARGGKGFADAWDAALEIARERELARLRENMTGLSQASDEAIAQLDFAAGEAEPEPHAGGFGDVFEGIRQRLLSARRMLLRVLAEESPEKQRAWEVLVGPVDWDKARAFEPQDNEPFTVMATDPDMVLTVEAGLLPDLTGGPDALAEARKALQEEEEEEARVTRL